MVKRSKISVVILNYKLKDQVFKCIDSVLKSDYPNMEIIVVDNDSHDGIGNEITTYKNVTFIQNDRNDGFSGGYNIGIKKALANAADFVFILNPDTTIKKNTISLLYEGSQKYDAAIVSPKIYFSDSNIIWFAGKHLDLLNVLGNHIGVDKKDEGQFDKDLELNDTTGAAMLVRQEVFEKIGLLDERYFLYYEESDFCYRARKAGFKIMYIANSIVYHKNAQSTGLGSSLQDYYITRNRMLFASKFLPFRTQFALFREGLRNSKNKVRRKAQIDFLLGRFGKGEY